MWFFVKNSFKNSCQEFITFDYSWPSLFLNDYYNNVIHVKWEYFCNTKFINFSFKIICLKDHKKPKIYNYMIFI